MRERTPDIGSFLKNPLRSGVVWLSVYEAMSGEMSHESFAEMVKGTMQEGRGKIQTVEFVDK